MTRLLMSFDVVGKAEPKGSTRGYVRQCRDGRLVADVAPDNPKSAPWQSAIAWTAKAAAKARPPSTGPIELAIVFVLKAPRDCPRPYPTVLPDVDKLLRTVLDALTGVAYVDDGQVVAITARKEYGNPPRVEITVCER